MRWKRCLRMVCGGKDEESDDGPTRTGRTSAAHACVSMVKCVIGAGSFFLPYGLKQAGFWCGAISLLALGVLCDYIDYRVIQCKRKLFGGRSITYPDLAEATFGLWARRATYFFLLIQGLGACAVYAVFCGNLLHALVDEVTVLEWVLIIGAIEVLLSWIRSFSYVGATSVLGDAALVLGVVVVFIYGFKDGRFIDSSLNLPVIRILSYPQFFGTAAFLFSITMYLFPIESSMREPKRFYMSLHLAFFLTTIGNVVFACFAYMFFGDDVKQIVIDNLGESALVIVAKVALVIDLVFTFVIVFVPCRSVVEDSILGQNGLWHWWQHRHTMPLPWSTATPPPSPSLSLASSPSQSTSSSLFTSSSSSPFRSPSTSLTSSTGFVDIQHYGLRMSGGSDGVQFSYPYFAASANPVAIIVTPPQDPTIIVSEDRSVRDLAEEQEDLVPHWERVIVRTIMIGATVGLACAIPNVIDLVGLVVGISNSMNSFILPTLIFMRVRYLERNRGFISIYDLEEKRKEDRRREKRRQEREERKAARHRRRQEGKKQTKEPSSSPTDCREGSEQQSSGYLSDAVEERYAHTRASGTDLIAFGLVDDDNPERAFDSGGPEEVHAGGVGDARRDDKGRGTREASSESLGSQDSRDSWALWVQRVEHGLRGNERRSGLVYWTREAVHWGVHSLIVAFGVAMGVLTTVQAVQTVISDYS